MSGEPGIAGMLSWEDGLPIPQWQAIAAAIQPLETAEARREAWNAAGRQWLALLGQALGTSYELFETEHFLALLSREGENCLPLLPFAQGCRTAIRSILKDIADLTVPGKQIVLVMRRPEHYYRYIASYYPEGWHGASGGLHIRQGYSHIVLLGAALFTLETALAHELTHAALQHLTMPQWLEEGLAQWFEHLVSRRVPFELSGKRANRHRRYWTKHGLDAFWHGNGFSGRPTVQGLSYELAQVLVRLLIAEGRPQWFGWVRGPERRFLAFLKNANATDHGAAACAEHLGYDLGHLAAKFLGPGSWSPRVKHLAEAQEAGKEGEEQAQDSEQTDA